jgi:hypothetical protein
MWFGVDHKDPSMAKVKPDRGGASPPPAMRRAMQASSASASDCGSRMAEVITSRRRGRSAFGPRANADRSGDAIRRPRLVRAKSGGALPRHGLGRAARHEGDAGKGHDDGRGTHQ